MPKFYKRKSYLAVLIGASALMVSSIGVNLANSGLLGDDNKPQVNYESSSDVDNQEDGKEESSDDELIKDTSEDKEQLGSSSEVDNSIKDKIDDSIENKINEIGTIQEIDGLKPSENKEKKVETTQVKDKSLPNAVGYDVTSNKNKKSKFPVLPGFTDNGNSLTGTVVGEFNNVDMYLLDYDEDSYLLSVGIDVENCRVTQSYVDTILKYYGTTYKATVNGPEIDIKISK